MSNSYDNFIALSDEEDVIRKKASLMITDPRRIKREDPGHPEVCNVFSYYKVFKPKKVDEVRIWCEGAKKGCTECKKELAEILIDYLKPIRKKSEKLLKDKGYINDILKKGAEKATEITSHTMKEVYKAVGMK